MSEILCCLTSSAELWEAAGTAASAVDLWLLNRDGIVVDDEVTIRVVPSEPDCCDRRIDATRVLRADIAGLVLREFQDVHRRSGAGVT